MWGYQEVRSPTIEFIEALSTGVGPELVETMFKFQDFDGKILALRAEMTAPVARIVTTKMTTQPEPIRLFYVSNVFRYSPFYVEREREFWQAGVELVGSNTADVDGEILTLLISSLKKLGLRDARIDVGHASLLQDLLKTTALDEAKKGILQNLLTCRDEARLDKFMDQHEFPSRVREAILQLACCRRLEEVSSVTLDSSEYREAHDHLRHLLGITDVLDDYGVKNLVFFDFSLARNIEYYTGMVFEASVPDLGLPLGGGGRYDNFIEKFGNRRLPATGFALEIAKCLQALTAQGFQPSAKTKTTTLISSKFRTAAIKAATVLRDAGLIALLDVTNRDEKQVMNAAKTAGIEYVVFVESSLEQPVTVRDLRSGRSRNVMINTLLQSVGGQS